MVLAEASLSSLTPAPLSSSRRITSFWSEVGGQKLIFRKLVRYQSFFLQNMVTNDLGAKFFQPELKTENGWIKDGFAKG